MPYRVPEPAHHRSRREVNPRLAGLLHFVTSTRKVPAKSEQLSPTPGKIHDMLRNIMLICTGNICRSPMAEAVFLSHFAPDGVQICSAGIAALVGQPPDQLARLVMQERGYDISEHRAQQATLPMLARMDLILGLEQVHIDWITERFPHLRGRAHKLGRWLGNADIDDPYHRPKAEFERAFQEIDNSSREWMKRIKALAAGAT